MATEAHATPQRSVHFANDGSPAAPTPPVLPPLAYRAMIEEEMLDQKAVASSSHRRQDSSLQNRGRCTLARILCTALFIVALIGMALIIYGVAIMQKHKSHTRK